MESGDGFFIINDKIKQNNIFERDISKFEYEAINLNKYDEKSIGEFAVTVTEAPKMFENIFKIFTKQYCCFSQERDRFPQTLKKAVKKLYINGVSNEDIAEYLDLPR
ncbi:MAG: hypothetical protein LBD73_08655, partial [Deferribacteraceae bacterium]|nr:hypothetical protein [Deferribacteraceae bacterium]